MRLRVAPVFALLPGALVVYLSFNAGGFYPGAQSFAAVLVWVALAAWIALADRPFAGLSWPLAGTGALLAGFCLWILVSGGSSDSSARALLEFDRGLLYLGVFLLFGISLRTREQFRWLIWGLAAAITVVCAAALITRLLPDVWETAPNLSNERLSYPLTYWNALGLLGSIGVVLCLHLACRAAGSRVARVLAAAAIPLLATTVYFTFSRGAIAAGIVGVVAYLLLGRPRGVLSGLLATVPATAVALVVAYDADLLATADPTTRAATEQGHDVAVVVGACMIGAAVIRFGLLRLDRIVGRMGSLSEHNRGRLRLAGAALAGIAIVAALVAGVPGEIGEQYDRFAEGDPVTTDGDFRERLTQPGSAARLRQWEVSLDQFERATVAGEGARSYELAWNRERPILSTVVDAHSLYLEVLGELGLIGIVLLAGVLIAILVGFGLGVQGPNRPTYAALLAAAVTWIVHAGVDWDWEMTAVTVWLFAAGGMGLAAVGPRPFARVDPPLGLRLAIALPLVLLMIVPLKVLSSEAWLDRGREAFARNDCANASPDAEASLDALGSRPEPYELLGYCAIRDGDPELAMARMEEAIDRDPKNWNLHYGLALARAAAGQDPGASVRTAVELNPLDPLVLAAQEAFDTQSPREWRRRARFLARQLTTL